MRYDVGRESKRKAVAAAYLFGYKLDAVARDYGLSKLETAELLLESGILSRKTIEKIRRESKDQ